LIQGLLSGLERKNCWTIAEHLGHSDPEALQHLLSRAKWDDDGACEDLLGYVLDAFNDPAGILVVDETGDLKKGTLTVGVQRQYTGTAGRIENAQVAVYLTYTAPRGHALIDRALYLPKSWVQAPERLAVAGVPANVEFATKPALALRMIGDALDTGAQASWVTGDEVYGNDPALRAGLQDRGVGYVLAVSCDHRIPTNGGPVRADSVARGLPPQSWQRLSAGIGSKGPRLYSWAYLELPTVEPGQTWILMRRNDSTGELAYYRCYHPCRVPLGELVRVAGQRWTIEESFQAAKGQAGLDEHQVRTWTSWHRWTVLCMLAMAFLAVITATERDRTPTPAGMIRYTLNEIRRLFDALTVGPATRTHDHILHWSSWRRRHQAIARECHYRRRSEHP
jgi:SRSO17 transposase